MLLRSLIASFAVLVAGLPIACPAKTIIGDIVDVTGTPLRVKISIEKNDPDTDQIFNKPHLDKTFVCSLYGVRSLCYQYQDSSAAADDNAVYGGDLIFEKPIPIITIHLLGLISVVEWDSPCGLRRTEHTDDGLPTGNPCEGKSADAILAERLAMPEADLEAGMQPDKMTEFVESADPYFFDRSFFEWSYQPIERVKDGEEVFGALYKLTQVHPRNNCPTPDKDTRCGGIFRFTSPTGYSGFAFCTYTHVNDTSSTPTGCFSLYYKIGDKVYVAAYIKPAVYEGDGTGFEGLSCRIDPEEIDKQSVVKAADSVKIITDLMSESKIGIDFKPLGTPSNHSILYGVRAFAASRVLPHKYEYTTGTLTVSAEDKTKGLDLSVSGAIDLTLNSQNVRDRKSFLEPDDRELTEYKSVAGKDMKARFAKAFGTDVSCVYE